MSEQSLADKQKMAQQVLRMLPVLAVVMPIMLAVMLYLLVDIPLHFCVLIGLIDLAAMFTGLHFLKKHYIRAGLISPTASGEVQSQSIHH